MRKVMIIQQRGKEKTPFISILRTEFVKLKPPSRTNAMCQGWLKFTQWFWRRRILSFVNVLTITLMSPLEKRCGPLS